ncbi:MAG: A/G-specific adenine glycosylase [Planctomycetes bacterium]|nr:A/G-specific adenine glycosylase [Planctomycetota bacterium]
MGQINKTKIHQPLLSWFGRAARDLPFRGTHDPYRIWLSEMMLQQTQVRTVIPYYERFLKKLPTIQALAKAQLDTVLKLWQGLGYYTRAKNLHKAARLIIEKHDGEFPRTFEAILALPGIGRYTAGAIGSIAFGLRKPVLDGNVIRVLCRWYAVEGNPADAKTREKLWRIAEELLPIKNCGDWNQAMMELGAEICTPKNPRCTECPVRRFCEAFKKGVQDVLPLRKKGKKIPHYTVAVAVLFDSKGRLLIDKRRVEGFLGGLWELPGGKKQKNETLKHAVEREVHEETGLCVRAGKKLCVVKHVYSHFAVTLHTYLCSPVYGNA